MTLTRFERDGLAFDVRDTGPADGEAVVLLHGFPQTSGCWTSLAGDLAAAGYRVLAFDQRGYTADARPPDVADYRLSEVVADAVALLDAAGITRAHVVGHDWGAIVGWGLAAAHPDRLHTFTALSVPHPAAVVRVAPRSTQPLRSAYVPVFLVPRLAETLLLAAGARPLSALLAASGLPEPHRGEYVARMREPRALSCALAWYRAASRRDVLDIGPARVPTLLVQGSRDPSMSPAAFKEAGRHVAASFDSHLLDGAGHWLPETRGPEVLRLLLPHLGAVSGGQR